MKESNQTSRVTAESRAAVAAGIAVVSPGKLLLAAPPDRSRRGTLRYALGFVFQVAPRTAGVMAMRTIEETPNYGYLDGSDVILLDELKPPGRRQVFAANRTEWEEGAPGEPSRLFMKSPFMGGFVPRGALRENGAAHRHAGTGFGIAQAHRFPFRDGRFSWGDPARQDVIEVYQTAFDGSAFTTRRTGLWPQNPRNMNDSLRIGDSGWSILVTGLGNAIPDCDDLLMATLVARADRTMLSAGVVRWARRDERWQPIEFDAVVTARQAVPEGPNPMERCPWMEPSLARDAADGLLFSVRCADSFQQPGDDRQGYRICLWRSAGAGQWSQMLDVPDVRLNSPVTVNVAADGSAYMVSNPYDAAFVPETDTTGRGREKLALWPLSADWRRLEPALLIRDGIAEFGQPPSAGRPEFWMADHPHGMTVRLGDGRWHHLLSYRICHCPRYRPSGTVPSRFSGCCVEEIASRGPFRPAWRFGDDPLQGLFTLSGSPYRHNAQMTGRPLRPEELIGVLDLDRPGLEAVQAAVVAGDCEVAAAALLKYYQERRAPGWMTGQSFDPLPVHRIVGRAGDLPKLPASADDRRIADDAERHVFHILQPASSYPSHDYGPDIDWDANPVNDIEWPCGMHRLPYWDGAVTRCYSATGDERYARLWVGLVTDWIRKNPLTIERLPFSKSWDAIQVGIRAQRLAGNLPRYLDRPGCTPGFLVELLTSLYNHARRIEQMPYPNIDNFVMIETLGLASIAALFPEFREAPKWKSLVMERLTAALRAQVLADSTHGELVPAYHLLITRYYLELIDLFGAEAVTPELRAATERMAEFCLAISAPDRRAFFAGDTNTRLDLRPALATAGRVLNRPDFLAAATEGQEGRWPEQRNYAFKDGGFYTFRSGWDAQAVWLGLHCGPEPLEPFHSQFDRGTFEMMAFGRMLMVDPGVFNYKSGDPGREAFRRTATHQCLTLSGANAARAGRCLQWIEDDGRGNAVLTVENASYPMLTHRRTVFFVQRRWFVFVDEALGAATGDLDLHFQFTPGSAVVDLAGKTARTDFAEGGNVLVWADPAAPVMLEAEEAWYSPKWFEKEPLPAFRYRHQLRQAPVRFVTVVAPYEGRYVPAVGAALEPAPIGAPALRLKVAVSGAKHVLETNLPDNRLDTLRSSRRDAQKGNQP